MARKAPIVEPRDSHDQAASVFGDFTGEISGDVWIVGVQANYRF
jgi:long-chain fatty acid transport protein